MGSNLAQDLAYQVAEGNMTLNAAVRCHLQSNCFPSQPSWLVAPCVAAILAVATGEDDEDIELPPIPIFDEGLTVSAGDLVRRLHLEWFTASYEDFEAML